MKVVQFSPGGFDYMSNQMTEGMHLLDIQGEVDYLCSGRVNHHGSKIGDLDCISDDDALVAAKDWADIVICSSGGDARFQEGAQGECLRDESIARKLVFIDGHDSSAFLTDPSKIRLYLKRELRYPEARMLAVRNVRSLTFGVYQFHIDYLDGEVGHHFDERDIDVGFVAFGGSSPIRQDCAEIIRANFKNSLVMVDQDKQPLPLEEYWRQMRRCKAIVSVQGAGLDTLRFWEAMGFGAVLCSVDIPNAMVVRDAPEPMRHAIYFENFNLMVAQMQALLSNPVQWTDIRRAADKLIRCRHTTRARARQLINLFGEVSP
jgi:hypothetical protein